MSLLPAEETQQAIVPTATPDDAASGLVAVIERLAMNPNIDVAKLEKVIELQERILAYHAKAQYNAAFAEMQPQIPVILERGRTDKGKYATLEDIIEVVRPILAKHGFGLNHKTRDEPDGRRTIIGILKHRAGHAEESEFTAPADKSGSKNDVQALGSTGSYGRRYTTNDLLCIVTRGEDDDARKAGKASRPSPPDGYEDWLLDMETASEGGSAALEKAWKGAAKAFQAYTRDHNAAIWNVLKNKAAKVKA